MPPTVEQTLSIAAAAIATALVEAGLPLATDDGAPGTALYSVLYLLKMIQLT